MGNGVEHVIDFEKRNAIKSEILADLIAEWMESSFPTEGVVPESSSLVCCDGAWGAAGVRAAAILTSALGIKLRYAVRL
jgi:ribonuclease HI